MTGQVPSIGHVVLYTIGQTEANTANRAGNGNRVLAGDVYPAVIVHVWGDQPDSACNLQVLLDGPGTYWATSRQQAEEDTGTPGRWHWPPRASGSDPRATGTRRVEVLVQGRPIWVTAHDGVPLGGVVEPALREAGLLHHPLNQWEMRGEAGDLLDESVPLGDYGFGGGKRMYLNLRAGVGG
ncbi:MAG TPA: DUF2604 domain-containing protein [Pseudonocardiaceae bacterium]